MTRWPALLLLGAIVSPATLLAQPAVPTAPMGTTAILEVSGPSPSAPAVNLTLLEREGHINPTRHGFAHTGGGNIDVAQPAADTLVVTMTGVAVAGAHPCKDSLARIDCALEQCFEVALVNPEEKKKLKLTLEARVIGLLRSHVCGGGSAGESGCCATITCGSLAVATVCAPGHVVAGGENLSLNDHDGPVRVPIAPGKYTLHQLFHVSAVNPHCLLPCKAASAEIAPDPALDPVWISYFEPFHGAQKKDFGFQVTIKVEAED
jgi:hypothetical protein